MVLDTEWQAKEREVYEALTEGERGEVHEDGESFVQVLADDAGMDMGKIERRADV